MMHVSHPPLVTALWFIPWAAGSVIAIEVAPSDITNGIVAFTGLVTAYGIYLGQRAAAETRQKTDEIKETARAIEGHVNSAATRDAGIISAQKIQLELKDATIVELRQAAAMLAQATAVANARAAVPPMVIVGPSAAPVAAPEPATKHLEQIEQHTADTATNTAKTDAVVQELKDKA